jgi:WD40 repeat protein
VCFVSTGSVLDVALSQDGVLGASCSDDFLVKVWDLEHKECLQTCKGHTGWVVAVKVRGCTTLCVVWAGQGTDRCLAAWGFWAVPALGVLAASHMPAAYRLVSVSPCRFWWCFNTPKLTQKPFLHGAVCWGEPHAGVLLPRHIQQYLKRVSCCRCFPNPRNRLKPMQFVGASHMVVSCSHDGTARVWDAWSGDCAAVLEGHTGRLNAVVNSLDSSVIITCSDDNTARVWDGSSYKLMRWVCLCVGHVGSAAASGLWMCVLDTALPAGCGCRICLLLLPRAGDLRVHSEVC